MKINLNVPMIVFLIFMTLKLTDTIGWSWWWITSPIWIAIIVRTLIVGILPRHF